MSGVKPRVSRTVVSRLGVALGVLALAAGAAGPVLAIGGAWTATGSMTSGHGHHQAALLPDGRVLVAAGYGPPGASISTSSDLYNPATGTFSAGGQLNFGRIDFAAASLADGRVLVTGGSDDFGYLWSAELFNPATGTWSITGNMGQARSAHTATLLNTGKVLVAGGVGPFCAGCNSGMTAELFDPATGTFSPTGSMTTARADHTATLLSRRAIFAWTARASTRSGDGAGASQSGPSDTLPPRSTHGHTPGVRIVTVGGQASARSHSRPASARFGNR